MFPLLQLPSSCIQNVADQWKTVELYEFSFLSKRAKGVSKRKKVDNSVVHFDFFYRIITIYKDGGVDCRLGFEHNRYFVEWREPPSLGKHIILFLQATQNFLKVTNCSFQQVGMKLKAPLTVDQLIMTIDWLNESKTEIGKVFIFRATWQMFEIFMNRFRKPVDTLMVLESDIDWDGTVLKPLKFEIKELFSFQRCLWLNIDFLLSIDTKTISVDEIDISAQDLNMFLRSWQEGKTNQNLNMVDFVTCSEIDVKEVVKDCGGVLMDPRTTKVKFSDREFREEIWIYGGIYIRRNDGRLAVIQTNTFQYSEDDRDVEKYLRTLEIWNSEEASDKWMRKEFFILFDTRMAANN
uniref:FBA_2 domain-containing protein n=1 Tax=Caenorhabditis tropicalis TaxID=1561998 RepID=A0A1I7T4P4_9PELO